MNNETRDVSKKANTPPGSLIHIGERLVNKTKIIFTKYSSEEFYREEIENINEFFGDDGEQIKWLSIIGLHNTENISELGEKLGLHLLIQEDILNTTQSPKLEEYEDHTFLITKSIFYNDKDKLETEQISFLLYRDKLISFQEKESDIFASALNRLKEGIYIRKNNVDDLLYALLDSIVDNYFLIIENLGNRIDIVEDELLVHPKKELLEKIYNLKKDLIFFRSVLWPMRNLINSLSKNEYELIDEKTTYYMRDIYDHIIQMIDIIETYRDICSGMLDIYLSSIGNKTNEVMKVLTIFSTIFIPLTFLAGVYGMNFKYLPELNWKYSYLGFWVISLITTGFMLRFFKKKGWL